MGVERVVPLPAGVARAWPAARERLVAAGESPVIRMIDGLPAFPDEVPDEAWRELRLGLAAGMVTVRRDGAVLRVVTWGTDDPALAAAADSVVRAFSGS